MRARPSERSSLPSLSEIGVEVFRPNGLDHLDRNELVERTAKVAVVLEENRDALAQPCVSHTCDRQVVLFAGYRRGGHAASETRRRVDRHAAPTRSHLEQMVVGTKLEFAADPVEACLLRLFEGHVVPLPKSGRIHHRRVEPERVEIISKVVVIGDVATTPVFRVASHSVIEAFDCASDEAEPAAVEVTQTSGCPEQDSHGRNQVVGRPKPVHVALARAEAAAEGDGGPCIGVVDLDGGSRPRIASAKHVGPSLVDHGELTEGDFVQAIHDEAACEPRRERRRQLGPGRQGNGQ